MSCVFQGTFDTRQVAKSDRLDFWEERCSLDVVGLTCTTMEEDGLQARFDHYDFGAFSVFDISGRPHVICRSAETVRKVEKDSVFLTLIVEGNVFVNRRDRCDVMSTGDLVLYDTKTPYMHGFPNVARQVVFDLPGPEFRQRFPGWDLRDTLKIEGTSGPGVAIGRAMRKTFSDVQALKFANPEPRLAEDIWSALELTHDLVLGGGAVSSYHLGIIQRARSFIRSRLDDPALDTGAVAAEIGMSARQLNRILGQAGQTVKKMILAERLERARCAIERDKRADLTLTELAYNCGFSGPSQFSKSFRRHFGVAPSAVRAPEGPPH